MNEFLKELESFEPIIKAECRKEEILGMSWEDQAQEVRIKLWLNKDKFDENKASFKTWANRVMINCLKNLIKGSKTKKASYLNDADDLDNIIEEEALDL
jgi:RNA polymerase sigma factor (sigma-70 family)